MSEQAYEKFWESLSPSYPISKGIFKLPIVSELISLSNINHLDLKKNLQKILEDLLEQHGTQEQARLRASTAGEGRITQLITDDYTGVVRFDCVVDDKTKDIKVLEINCDYPDGLILHDKTYSILSGTDSTKHTDLLSIFFKENEEIAVIHHKDAVFLDAYHSEKIAISSTTTEGVSIGGALTFDKAKRIRRCLEVSKLSDEDCLELSKKDHTYVNTFALRTLGYKDLLSSSNHSYVPKTHTLNEECLVKIKSSKDSWILKPLEGCEGEGIYFGKDISDEEWEQLLNMLINKQYIAQEFVTLSKLRVPLFQDGSIVEKDLYYDLCPHFFISKGKVVGNGHTLMRFSEHPVVNVTKGGGIGYLKD